MGCLGFVLAGFFAYGIHDSWTAALALSAVTVVAEFWADRHEKTRPHVYGFCFGSAIGYGCAVLDVHTAALLIATAVSAWMAWFLHRPSDDEATSARRSR
ncbi:hypothetical protein [Streptacidiphilus anmyonensis]|uniref:hypothetical protein n=1 Tax=Streptacidiphilus anmyonensis TaxID=405782 RepID=UPI0005AB5A4F|nr:hypothetical protein [Streptacidiphilus anmyonensis]